MLLIIVNSMNYIQLIEKSIKEWSSREPNPDDVKRISELLGVSSKKSSYVLNRWFNEILGKYIDKKCVSISEDVVECIYSPVLGTPPRYFPVVLHATGTVLLFEKDDIKTIAFPIHRARDLGIHGVSIPEDKEPIEITERLDGWQITFYYDPILKKWIAATRYVLHNMRYEKGKLIIEEFGNIINPYVEVAMIIAEETGLLNKFKGFEGWTFTFTLVGPEPAILKPGAPSKWNWDKYKLYLIAARKPDGTLLTTRESAELLKIEHVPTHETKSIQELVNEIQKSLTKMSYFLRYGDDNVTPTIIEIKSTMYPEAMNLKYYNDAKSFTILLTEGYGNKILNLIQDEFIKNLANETIQLYNELVKKFEIFEKLPDEFLNRIDEIEHGLKNEFIKNWRRGLRKLLANYASKMKDIQPINELLKELLNLLK